MKIMFSGGGTAGHVSPAIAMAQIISERYPDAEFIFVGRQDGDENRAITRRGYQLETLDVEGLSRKLGIKSAVALFKAGRALIQARTLIKRYAPDMVIGTGGYVSWPILRAASGMKIPTLIHESNAYPGLVTRMMAGRCSAVMLGFAEAAEHLKRPRRVFVTGNPVTSDFSTSPKHEARVKLGITDSEMLIISFGGSLGAEVLNESIAGAMKKIASMRYRITHIHATGRRHYDDMCKSYPELVKARGTRLMPYIEDMGLWMSAADLAITRSGAMTVAELDAAGLPAILIPSPNVTDDHQTKNAKAAVGSGRAMIIPEGVITSDRIANEIASLYKFPERLERMRTSRVTGCSDRVKSLFLDAFNEIYKF